MTAFSDGCAAGLTLAEAWGFLDSDLPRVSEAMQKTGMRLAATCQSFFRLNDPAFREEYKRTLCRTVQIAQQLHCPGIITQAGEDNGRPRAEQHRAIVEGLREMVPILTEGGVTLLVEPLNNVRDHKGTYLTDSEEGFEIIREVNDPHVRLLFDIYHQLHMGEDVEKQILENLPLIGHFHAAGFPNRDDRMFEQYDYTGLFDAMQAAGVTAPIGLELHPASPEARRELYTKIRRWMD